MRWLILAIIVIFLVSCTAKSPTGGAVITVPEEKKNTPAPIVTETKVEKDFCSGLTVAQMRALKIEGAIFQAICDVSGMSLVKQDSSSRFLVNVYTTSADTITTLIKSDGGEVTNTFAVNDQKILEAAVTKKVLQNLATNNQVVKVEARK